VNNLNWFITLLEKLDEKKIYYRLTKTRDHTITIEVSIPGQRWDIEYNTYGEKSGGSIEIEKIISNGTICGEEELETLFRDFSE